MLNFNLGRCDVQCSKGSLFQEGQRRSLRGILGLMDFLCSSGSDSVSVHPDVTGLYLVQILTS